MVLKLPPYLGMYVCIPSRDTTSRLIWLEETWRNQFKLCRFSLGFYCLEEWRGDLMVFAPTQGPSSSLGVNFSHGAGANFTLGGQNLLLRARLKLLSEGNKICVARNKIYVIQQNLRDT
jgi:hypothetical protein